MEKKLCKCGCGTEINAFDRWGREISYVNHHSVKDPNNRKKQSIQRKGKRPEGLTFKGKKHTQESKEKTGTFFKGKPKTKEHRNKLSEVRKGKFVGEKSPTWKGGMASLKESVRHLFEYRQWRSDIFTRDEFTCKRCGDNTGGNLHAHHIKHLAKIIEEYSIATLDQARVCEELWNINNGITFCKTCHKQEHKKML